MTIRQQLEQQEEDFLAPYALKNKNSLGRKIFEEKDYDKNVFLQKFSQQVEKLFAQFDSKIILDKSPLNFIWIGFIKLLFPKAKIIHCKRNLRDVGLSIYKNFFDGGHLPWSYSEETLIKFIEAYKDLMNFWN